MFRLRCRIEATGRRGGFQTRVRVCADGPATAIQPGINPSTSPPIRAWPRPIRGQSSPHRFSGLCLSLCDFYYIPNEADCLIWRRGSPQCHGRGRSRLSIGAGQRLVEKGGGEGGSSLAFVSFLHCVAPEALRACDDDDATILWGNNLDNAKFQCVKQPRGVTWPWTRIEISRTRTRINGS